MRHQEMAKRVPWFLAPLFSFLLLTVCDSAPSEENSLRILRPKIKGKQIAPTWTEIYYIVIDAKHPDGIAKLQLFKEGAKQPEKAFSEDDRHESGYFLHKRRMKSAATRDYVIRMWPIGSDPEKDEPIVSERSFPLQYSNPDPEFPNFLAFVNRSDGDRVPTNDPEDESDVTYIFVDCQDSNGTWGQGQWKGDRQMGYRDDDGIDWVELVITGPDGEVKVLRNGAALILDRDQNRHGAHWGEPEDPTQTKSPEEPWPDGVAWKPIEGFGLYQFTVSLLPGSYQLVVRAKNNEGEIVEGPSIGITADGQ